MPLWLDLLRTPMAAPETATLKRMRLVWQSLCFSTAAGAAFFGPIHRAVGRGASGGMAILLSVCVLWTAFYFIRKHSADSAYLDTVGNKE